MDLLLATFEDTGVEEACGAPAVGTGPLRLQLGEDLPLEFWAFVCFLGRLVEREEDGVVEAEGTTGELV